MTLKGLSNVMGVSIWAPPYSELWRELVFYFTVGDTSVINMTAYMYRCEVELKKNFDQRSSSHATDNQ